VKSVQCFATGDEISISADSRMPITRRDASNDDCASVCAGPAQIVVLSSAGRVVEASPQ
jgi:hypothetical protein